MSLTSVFDAARSDDAAIADYQARRMELGWGEVRVGLDRILIGHLCMFAGLALFFLSVVAGERNLLMLGFGVLLILGVVGYCFTVVGEWKCLFASERRGAKWLVFGALLCLILVPDVEGITRGVKLKDDAKQMLQVVSASLSILSFVLFVSFLAAVGSCFENRGLVQAAILYLLYTAVLVAASVYVVMNSPTLETHPQELFKHLAEDVRFGADPTLITAIGIGWLVNLAWYLGLIFLGRTGIRDGIRRLQSPFANRA